MVKGRQEGRQKTRVDEMEGGNTQSTELSLPSPTVQWVEFYSALSLSIALSTMVSSVAGCRT